MRANFTRPHVNVYSLTVVKRMIVYAICYHMIWLWISPFRAWRGYRTFLWTTPFEYIGSHGRVHIWRSYALVTPESLTYSWVTQRKTQRNARVTPESLTYSRVTQRKTQRNAAQRTSHSRVTHLLTSYACTHAWADAQRNARVTPESLVCSRVTHARTSYARVIHALMKHWA